MPDLFGLFFRMIGGSFKVAAYTVVFIAQSAWFVSSGRRDKIGDALGSYGKSVIDACVEIARGR